MGLASKIVRKLKFVNRHLDGAVILGWIPK
jgi:hypothetical protein